jgi:SNF2 family DNA or RNA helicase
MLINTFKLNSDLILNVTPSMWGFEVEVKNLSGNNLTIDQARNQSNGFDQTIFKFESANSFMGSDEKLSASDTFPFRTSEINKKHFDVATDKILISYPLIYSIEFGQLIESTALTPDDLRLLGIPKYELIRSRVSALQDYLHPQFRLKLELYDQYGVKITPINCIGHCYSVDGKLKLLPPVIHSLIRCFEFHENIRNSENYKNTPNVRKQEYAFVRDVALKAGAQLDTFIAQENVIFLESLPYEISRDTLNRPVVTPVLPWSIKEFDHSFQIKLERKTDGSLPDHIPIQKDRDGNRTRVAFSETAWKEYQFIKELGGDKAHLLDEVADDPSKYFSSAPRVPIDDVFSDRVAGFIIGKKTTNRADSSSGREWSSGYEEHSLILRTGPSSRLKLDSSPTPVEYEILKKAYSSLEEEITKNEEKSFSESGLVFTPLPPQLEQRIKIPELGIEVSLTELHNVCKAIEVVNTPKLSDEEVPKALEALAAAESSGAYLVKWTNTDGITTDIPVSSLRRGVPKIKADPSNDLHVAPELVEQVISKIGIPPVWHWSSFFPSRKEGLRFFKDDKKLMPHQEIGYAWLRWLQEHIENKDMSKKSHRGALLADDMGLGKTIQLLALITHTLSKPDSKFPVLVVAPMSLINDAWKIDAVDAFLDPGSIKVVDLKDCPTRIDSSRLAEEAIKVTDEMAKTGKPFHQCAISSELKKDINKIQEWCNGKLIFCSYETLRSKSVLLASIKFSLVILDEAQKIKNIGVLQSNAAKALNSDFYVAMTGTPIENSLMDLWSIMDFSVPGHLGDQSSFKSRFVNRIKDAEPGSSARSQLKNELEELLKPVWLRRTKSEIFKDDPRLPAIIHHDSDLDASGVIKNPHLVVMSKSQMELYDEYMGIFNTLTKGHRLAAIQSLMQVCSSPWLKTDISVNWDNHTRLFDICPKLEMTFKILDTIHSNAEADGRKVVIFANTIETQISLAYLIADWHKKVKFEKLEVEVFNGEKSQRERTEILQRFKESKGFQVLIISPKSGGAGLNIVEANHVIHYTREWNPALESQATARCYRIGQKRKVHVYYPTTSTGVESSPGAEEHLAEILRKKRDVMEDFTISLDDHSISEEAFSNFQSKRDSGSKVVIDFEKIAVLSPVQFEKLVTVIFKKKGFRSNWIGAAGDRGADVVALSNSENILIQAKHTQRSLTQHTEGVNEIRGAHSVYETQYSVRFKLAVVTNGRFSEQAINLSRLGTEVLLYDCDWIKQQLASTPIFLEEIEEVGK